MRDIRIVIEWVEKKPNQWIEACCDPSQSDHSVNWCDPKPSTSELMSGLEWCIRGWMQSSQKKLSLHQMHPMHHMKLWPLMIMIRNCRAGNWCPCQDDLPKGGCHPPLMHSSWKPNHCIKCITRVCHFSCITLTIFVTNGKWMIWGISIHIISGWLHNHWLLTRWK